MGTGAAPPLQCLLGKRLGAIGIGILGFLGGGSIFFQCVLKFCAKGNLSLHMFCFFLGGGKEDDKSHPAVVFFCSVCDLAG